MSRYKNCTDCPHHEVVPDPDPTDWFCDDDVAVVCKLTTNTGVKHNHVAWKRFLFRPVTIACRPYNMDKECDTPKWCPLD